jgi:hypothetical protein
MGKDARTHSSFPLRHLRPWILRPGMVTAPTHFRGPRIVRNLQGTDSTPRDQDGSGQFSQGGGRLEIHAVQVLGIAAVEQDPSDGFVDPGRQFIVEEVLRLARVDV